MSSEETNQQLQVWPWYPQQMQQQQATNSWTLGQQAIPSKSPDPKPDPMEVYAKKVRMKHKRLRWTIGLLGLSTVSAATLGVGVGLQFGQGGLIVGVGVALVAVSVVAWAAILGLEPWKED